METKRKTKTVSKRIRKGLDKAANEARKLGGRVADIMAETPEFVALKRTDRALRSEMDDRLRAIGKRALVLHKRSKKDPFATFPAITRELANIEKLEEEYRTNRTRLNEVKREMKKGKGR